MKYTDVCTTKAPYVSRSHFHHTNNSLLYSHHTGIILTSERIVLSSYWHHTGIVKAVVTTLYVQRTQASDGFGGVLCMLVATSVCSIALAGWLIISHWRDGTELVQKHRTLSSVVAPRRRSYGDLRLKPKALTGGLLQQYSTVAAPAVYKCIAAV